MLKNTTVLYTHFKGHACLYVMTLKTSLEKVKREVKEDNET